MRSIAGASSILVRVGASQSSGARGGQGLGRVVVAVDLVANELRAARRLHPYVHRDDTFFFSSARDEAHSFEHERGFRSDDETIFHGRWAERTRFLRTRLCFPPPGSSLWF